MFPGRFFPERYFNHEYLPKTGGKLGGHGGFRGAGQRMLQALMEIESQRAGSHRRGMEAAAELLEAHVRRLSQEDFIERRVAAIASYSAVMAEI